MTDNFRNPLGYYCPPNGCGPDYVAESEFERFIAFGMMVCYDHILGPGCEALNGIPNDVYWLRKNFLAEVQIALDGLPEMIAEAQEKSESTVSYQGDHDDSGPHVGIKPETWQDVIEDKKLCYQWRFDRLDCGDQPCLLFVLDWGEGDDYPIWLRLDAIYGPDTLRAMTTLSSFAKVRLVMKSTEQWMEEKHQGDV